MINENTLIHWVSFCLVIRHNTESEVNKITYCLHEEVHCGTVSELTLPVGPGHH